MVMENKPKRMCTSWTIKEIRFLEKRRYWMISFHENTRVLHGNFCDVGLCLVS